MTIDSNRLLLEFEKLRREINHNVLSPALPELSLTTLQPIITLVAEARRDYLKTFVELAEQARGQKPSAEQIAQLKARREAFDELMSAANALETAIQRDYLKVRTSRRD
ncbi:MAG: hypothetical protein V7756_08060 [Halopseudomonas sp.]|uniref:hypothetical protein n=1 Tax=Halopseudomonas sp. TaxID=2901191 RepID=UPI003002D4F5